VDIKAYIESGIIESYVLGLASPEETAELESLRTRYPELDAAIRAFEQKVELQGFRDGVRPPVHIRENLLETLQPEFAKEEPIIKSITGNIHPGWRIAAAASVILFLASAVWAGLMYNRYNKLSQDYNKLQLSFKELEDQTREEREKFNTLYAEVQIMQDSSVLQIRMKGVPGRENSLATVFWNRSTAEVYLLSNNLPQPAAGKQYQLWAIVDGKPVDAGVIGDCVTLCKLKNIPAAQAFAITLEKRGGSPTPTLSEMYVIGNI